MFYEKKEEESICSFLLRAFHLSSAKMHFAIKKKEKKKTKTHSIGLFITIYEEYNENKTDEKGPSFYN